MMLPPSPALSSCDSLDGIEDLDAYLAMQGNLSHFPTPPLVQSKTPIVQAVEIEDIISEYEDESPDYDHIALTLTEEASLDTAPMPDDIEKVLSILISADVPLVVVALAFNILCGLHSREAYAGRYTDCPPDLVIVTALSLAVTCTYDSPHSANFWSKHICHGRWTKTHIEQCIMKVLASLDYRLHEYSLPDRLDQAFSALSQPTEGDSQLSEDVQPLTPEKEPLKLVIDGTHSIWNHGQITPEETPCEVAFPAGDPPLHRFLRLL